MDSSCDPKQENFYNVQKFETYFKNFKQYIDNNKSTTPVNTGYPRLDYFGTLITEIEEIKKDLNLPSVAPTPF